jgi:hypothetical protein
VSEQTSLTLISFAAKVILNQFLVTHSFFRSQHVLEKLLQSCHISSKKIN